MIFYKLNTKHKDRLFRLIFNEKKELLDLYNAVNESNYTNPDDLEITTMEDVVYMGMKNDLSFIIGDELNLYEHQSTFSPNLPLRGFLYFASVYRAYIEPMKQKLYTDSPLYIPFPQYIVFYNGTKEEPGRQELKMSDLYIGNGKGKDPALECTAVVLNINLGHNKKLMERCKRLKEYAQLIAAIRKYLEQFQFEEAVEYAVEECIRKGILENVLRKNRNEVIEMILEEWDENEFREFLKEESWNEGHEAGKKIGMETGIKGIIKVCKEFGVSKEETLEKIKKEFALTQEDAEKYIEEYWT